MVRPVRRAFILAVLLGLGGCGEPDSPFHPDDLSASYDFARADLAMPDLRAPDLYQVSWHQQSVPVTSSLYAIAGAANEIYVVGDQGVILHTTDDGAHWKQQASGTNAALFGVWTDGVVAFAAGYHGTLLRSIDHGATWQTTILGSATLFGVSGENLTGDGGAATHLWAVGEANTVLQSTDGGATWIGSTLAGASSILRGVWASPSESFVVGDDALWRTRDDGVSFTALTFAEATGSQVWASGSGQILVAHGNVIVRSRDGGLTWAATTSPVSGIVVSAFAAFVDGELWVAQSNGAIDHYVNDFEQFVKDDSAQVPEPIKAIWGSADSRLFVVGDNGFIAHRQ